LLLLQLKASSMLAEAFDSMPNFQLQENGKPQFKG
jgi:hypothetical protein